MQVIFVYRADVASGNDDGNETNEGNMPNVTLAPLEGIDREQFIADNQKAFNYGALEEFGLRDNHFEEDGQIISRATIEGCLDGGTAYRILADGEKVGGLVLRFSEDGSRGECELLFVNPDEHGKSAGTKAWTAVERLYPNVKVWELVTPYFEKRNIHFYVNVLGFHIVEFFNSHHPAPSDDPEIGSASGENSEEHLGHEDSNDEMFRFEKVMRR
ncbi:GNAT family N-acetyltransferase [Bifidobacterium sp. UBA6881]|uniref:GNAT family N-acetyltransferase n=1 Tax=Bifidobacterium sp. UBA6881 TaxID=1946109 RepID=UPI0025C72B39|nr:GNAT family N-acetyltransferase [Bifidobacterium sp. UBA6881]